MAFLNRSSEISSYFPNGTSPFDDFLKFFNLNPILPFLKKEIISEGKKTAVILCYYVPFQG